MKNLFKLTLLAVLACPLFVSCYDDSELRETVDMLVDKVFDLEQKLNDEIAALKGLLDGKIFITEVALDPSGATNITLSNESVLQLLPQKDLKSYVTYVTLTDGTDCWAYIDENGQKQLFLDEKNHPIPVVAETPQVITKDDETYIVIGGQEYPLSGNSVFSDYEVITDEETGEVLAVTFTFGEAMTFTVSVNAAQGFWFVKDDSQEAVKFDSYFVQAGKAVTIQVKSKGVEDYVVQLPYGWKNREVQIAGLDYFQITAPSAELLANGAADSEGNVKVLAVLEGGKASAARLYVSTSPFKTMNISYGKLTLDPYPGVEEYVYGICSAAEYDKQAIVAAVNEGKMPEGGVEASEAIVSTKLEDLTKLAFVVGAEYVVWAYPVAEDALLEDAVAEYTFKYTMVEVAIVEEAFLDATVSLNLGGLDGYYIGVEPAAEYDEALVLSSLNSGIYTAVTEPMNAEASVFGLTGVTANHSTAYKLWFTVAETGKKYTAEDLIVIPFNTSTFAAGGNAAVSIDKKAVVAAPTSVQAPLTLTGGTMFFYTFVKADNKLADGTDNDIIDHLLKKGVQVEGASAVVSTADPGVALTSLKPQTPVVLFALGVDAEGKYGKLLKTDLSTSELTFRNLDFKVTLGRLDPGDASIVISPKGTEAEKYIYWVGRPTDTFWTSSRFLGASAETAAEYIALNMDNYRFENIQTAYPMDKDGKIALTDLEGGSNYVFVCASVDKYGICSAAEVVTFQIWQYPIGNVVYKSDSKWKSLTPTVEFLPETFSPGSGFMYGSYSFNIKLVQGYTAYVLCGADTYIYEGDLSKVMSPEEIIIAVIKNVDRRTSSDVVVNPALDYPYGSEFYYFQHGNPLRGNTVFWASKEYHDSVCDCGGEYDEQIEVNHLFTNDKGESQIEKVKVDQHHVLHYNDGTSHNMLMPSAVGDKTQVVDKIYVVYRDLDGNCYEAFSIDVPYEYFANAGARDE